VHTGRSWLCPLAAVLTVVRNWASSLGKLAVYSNSRSTTMYMYSGEPVTRISPLTTLGASLPPLGAPVLLFREAY